MDNFSGQTWSGNEQVQEEFARTLAAATTFEGDTSKKYSAFSARDRITRSPQGLGFVDLSPTIQLTEAGESFIHGNRPHEIFLRQLLKFQLPSPYHKEGSKIKGTFWGRPYLEIIRLIRDLDHLTPDEFRIFALQLTDYRNYAAVKNQIISFREEKEKHKGQYKRFVDDVINRELSKIYSTEIESGNIATRESKTSDVRSFISKEKRNMRDYADACFRYFRFTEMFVSDGRSIQIAPDKISEIDFILLTHAHIDHTGLLPMLFARGFRGQVYATKATVDLSQIMLRDSAHIQQFEAEWRNRKARRSGGEIYEPLYTMEDALGAIRLLVPCEYDKKVTICDEVTIRFTDVGHLLGSSSIEVFAKEGEEERTVVFSGDLGNTHKPILRDPIYTKAADYVVMESTYGDRLHGEEAPDYVGELAAIIENTFRRGGNVVVPSFAVGRTQEMLYFLRQIKEQQLVKTHPDFEVYVDSPLAVEATNIFGKNVQQCFDEEAKALVEK